MNESERAPGFETVGTNSTRLWGLTIAERNARIARASGIDAIDSPGDDADGDAGGAMILANAVVAFDPAWLRHLLGEPGLVLTLNGVPALAHVRTHAQAQAVRRAMETNTPMIAETDLHTLPFESGPTIENRQLRKRETPFLIPLTPDKVREIERASYFGAYKGVTDILTKYLWPEWALVLTRIAARLHLTPNMVTAMGAALCVAATFAFAYGHYWSGLLMGLIFMVLDTVDGKLARCTITSSWWGNVFDHGIDLVHPPFWWWFWATGLVHWGLALSDTVFWWVQGAIMAGYVIQRLIEGAFIAWFDGLHIHVWQPFDSWFRLITARRNPNAVILFASLIVQRPDLGIIAVAWWTAISCAVHLVRLIQAWQTQRRGTPITSWLAGESA